MDFRTREALRKSRIFLLENIIFDVLTDHLIDQDIFSETMLDYIKAGPDRVEKIRRLLDHLTRRPDSCYLKFLNALSNSGHQHCAIRIQENYVQSGPTQVSDPTVPGTVPMSACPGLPEDDVTMESSVAQEKSAPAPMSQVGFGFPEIMSSMNAFAGSFSSPVQVSSISARESSAMPAATCNEQSYDRNRGENQSVGTADSLSVYQRHMLSNPQGVYPMDTAPRGLALIINNENFKTMPPRTGSQRDMENLWRLLKKLAFDTCHQVDKTAQEIRGLLKSFAEYEPLRQVSALVVVILSHGGRAGIIFGREGSHKGHPQDFITDEEVRDMFSARNCPLMAHKPKLIIIQACRGVNEDVADGVHPCPPLDTNDSSNMQSNSNSTLGQDGSSSASNSSTVSSARIANMADICLIHSTVHGYVSYRHPIEGSPFIQEMTRVFEDMADREHLTDMMTEVNRKLASRQLQADVRTVPSTTNTLTRKWFFNPPRL